MYAWTQHCEWIKNDFRLSKCPLKVRSVDETLNNDIKLFVCISAYIVAHF